MQAERKVFLIFAAGLLAMFLICLLGFVIAMQYTQSARWITHTYQVLDEIESVRAAMARAETWQGKYILTGDSTNLLRRDERLSDLATAVTDVREFTRDNTPQQDRLNQLNAILARWKQQMNAVEIIRQSSGIDAARAHLSSSSSPSFDEQADNMILAMRGEERKLLTARLADEHRHAQEAIVVFAILLLTMVISKAALYPGIRRQIRERREAQLALRRQAGRLKAANKELESFTYSVSHDLRAPLRAIVGFADILESDYGEKLDDEGRRLLGVVVDNGKKMGALIDDLLAFSRLGRKTLQGGAIEMEPLVKEAMSEVLQDFRGTDPTVQVGALPDAWGDRSLVKQVWLNLLSNAVKYASKEGQARIEISGVSDGSDCTYRVQDNGVGFDMRYAGKLFGVFQRLHSEVEFPGTGVGLAIVQRIIAKHGGDIRADAKAGEGATFTFTLPCQENVS